MAPARALGFVHRGLTRKNLTYRKSAHLGADPFHLVESDFRGAMVANLRPACRGMVRHLPGAFERAAVSQISGDARCPKRVVADMRGDASGFWRAS